ncbi:MAG: TonB-dependent receptor, partial [Acidobacteria bacterium]|nr:TonB-dependent receptor [Acidobacteriota bacterium]
MLRKSLIVLVLALGFSTAGLAQIAGKMIGTLGRVEVQPAGQPGFLPAALNQTLNTGDVVRTGPQSRAVILLADETQLKLNANTQLQLAAVRQSSNLLVRVAQAGARADQTILNMPAGQAWLRAKKTPAAVRVNTPAVTAAIRGTEFDLRVAADGESIATVLEGSLDYRNDLGFVIVDPGEQGRARVGEAPSKVVIVNPRDAVQWTLFYSGSVSPRDYPFVYSSVDQARAALSAGPIPDPVRRAQAQHDAGDVQAALRTLQGVAAPGGAETRGWILLEQNQIAAAIEEFRAAAPESARARLGLSLAHYRLNEFEQAYDVVRQPGDDARLKLQKAMLDLIAGDVASSRSLLLSIPAGDSSYALAQGMISNIHLTQNDKDQALAFAQRAVQADAASPSAHLSLSLVQQSFFDLPAATRSAERALQSDPDFLQAQVQYARLLFGAGDSGEAETILRRALAVSAEEAAVTSALGFVLLARGETAEARDYFERSIQQDSSRGEPHLGMGIALMRENRHTDAVTELLAASTLEPQIALYQSYLGKAFYEERKFEQAFTALAAAVEIDPRDPTPHLYAGIFHNDLSRPGTAVRSFQESIRLNDNRAVYRSRFVLDEDRATRNVNLAAAYNRLGLAEWANLVAIRSGLSDPANSSAHLFLAGTFLNLKGRTLAAGGELLMARLLLPVNANSFNAFNDYTTLFELPRVHWTTEGRFGNFDTYGSQLISSGGTRRFAFSSLFSRSETEGFRPRNDDARDYITVNFAKVALTPHSDMLFSYSHLQTRQGDHGSSLLVSADNDSNLRAFTRRHRAEIGYHQRLRPGSDWILYLSGQTSEQVFDNPDARRIFGIRFAHRDSSRVPFLNFQTAHLLKISRLQLQYGLDVFEGRSRDRQVRHDTRFPLSDPSALQYCITDRLGNADCLGNQETAVYGLHKTIRYRTAFLQSDFAAGPRLILTAGLNYDWANDNNVFDDENNRSLANWGPRGGILFTPFDSTTLRFAAMRALQTHPDARLVPTHINGFLLHENELELSESASYHLGWDQRWGRNSFFRATSFWRERNTPATGELPDGLFGPINAPGRFYGG